MASMHASELLLVLKFRIAYDKLNLYMACIASFVKMLKVAVLLLVSAYSVASSWKVDLVQADVQT